MLAPLCPPLSQAVVLLSLLASIHLVRDEDLPPRLVDKFLFVKTPSDGRCFWSCLWLGIMASKQELLGWHQRPRNKMGVTVGQDADREKKVVCDWSLQLTGMPPETRDRIEKGQSAETDDIEAQHLYGKRYL